MLPLYLEYVLKINIANKFGNITVIEKNGITTLPYENIITNIKKHHNNLMGKVEICSPKFMFYYIPTKLIEKYETHSIGIPICHNISICPFCFGIQLSIEEQHKLYKQLNNMVFNDDINILIKEKYCFELIKLNIL